MQGYNPLLPSGLISDDRQTINDNMESIITDFSGTAFPTNNLYAGMKCNRTDQSKVYQLQSDLTTWKQIYDYNGTEITVPKANKAVLDVDDNPINTTYLKSVPVYVGATTSTAGVVGLVPSAQIYQKDYFLKGNGEWAAIAVMQGATTSAAGIAGLVPAPVAGDNVKFFTGAGKYQAVATQAQAEAGIDNSAPMTALRVKQAINAFVGNDIPTGTILPFAGNTIPEGFLLCNGAAVSRTTYAALFSAIGTTYGSGNGSTTFTLPNAQNGRLFTNSTPSITTNGNFTFNGTGVNTSDGTFHGSSYGASYTLTNSATFNLNVGSRKNYYSTFGVGVLPNTKQTTAGGSWGEEPKPFQYKSGLKITMPSYAAVKFIIKY